MIKKYKPPFETVEDTICKNCSRRNDMELGMDKKKELFYRCPSCGGTVYFNGKLSHADKQRIVQNLYEALSCYLSPCGWHNETTKDYYRFNPYDNTSLRTIRKAMSGCTDEHLVRLKGKYALEKSKVRNNINLVFIE